MPSSFGPSTEHMNLEDAHQEDHPDTSTTNEDFSELDMVTRADLDSLALSMEVKMQENNEALLEQI